MTRRARAESAEPRPAASRREAGVGDGRPPDDRIRRRIFEIVRRVEDLRERDLYFFNIPIAELDGGARVRVEGRELDMFSSYSYLGLLGHPRIDAAARAAIDRFGTGTHGVRLLAGSLTLHRELEDALAAWKGTDDAITFSSGYVTNLTTVASLVGREDYVFSDKLNHASIVDGCLLSGAHFVRFRHNDMPDLETRLSRAPRDTGKLVVVDAVFSMDGDIADLPRLAEICHAHDAWLMVDEAHSLGVLGACGRGIEEHFGLPGTIDVKMGTLSKTIPSVGGYIAGRADLVSYLRHSSRGYVFSAALPPAQAAAALEALRVIQDEPWRVETLRRNAQVFVSGLRQLGFDTLRTQTAIVPVLCRSDDRAYEMTRECHHEGIFVTPVVSPAVPAGQARLRATVTAAHTPETIDRALAAFGRAGRATGLL
ncbi:MAG TPA: aminotransferase class I/II-fold pyridoxal phosphate-dependent enzyme [Anaerolineales bacterium]